jgi:hypothetical protein
VVHASGHGFPGIGTDQTNWGLTASEIWGIILYVRTKTVQGRNMTDGKDAKLTIRIPRSLLEAAKEKSQTEDIPVSQYVRRCLMQWVGMLPTEDVTEEELPD